MSVLRLVATFHAARWLPPARWFGLPPSPDPFPEGKGHPAPATGGRGPSMNDNPNRSLSRVVIFRTGSELIRRVSDRAGCDVRGPGPTPSGVMTPMETADSPPPRGPAPPIPEPRARR
jgi:hypothetical protein